LNRAELLPEKFRFLLFKEKREIELVWNCEANEVCDMALPSQTIEQVDEPRDGKASDTALQKTRFHPMKNLSLTSQPSTTGADARMFRESREGERNRCSNQS